VPSDLSEIGERLLPRGELIHDETSEEEIFWLSPPLEDGGSRWLEINFTSRLAGYSAVLIKEPRFTDRAPWWAPYRGTANDLALLFTVEVDGEVRRDLRRKVDDLTRLLTFGFDLKFTGDTGTELASASQELLPQDQFEQVARELGARKRLGLFPVERPADTPCRIGWGSLHWQYHQLPMNVMPSVFLRSWEDRFGATVLVLGEDRMTVITQRFPASMEEAERLVNEHSAFCPEAPGLDWADEEDRQESIRALLKNPIWDFWWDE
jgi:Domain of unknown function (DUF4253)